MSKFLRKPKATYQNNLIAKYEHFNLKENPFPSEPIVNKESQDKRINGDIYEHQIRDKEFDHIINNFIKVPQSDPTHLRLGYIIDTSYIGRGNGKSAFLINLQNKINKDYCLDLSDEQNKCFSLNVAPEPGGRTKSFIKFVDLIFSAILNSNLIESSMSYLRLEAISHLMPNHDILHEDDENKLIELLSNKSWFEENKIGIYDIYNEIKKNTFAQKLPSDFPLHLSHSTSMFATLSTKNDFADYYKNITKVDDKINFIFNHMVLFFSAAGFNGAYILVDDFERIPDFQSARQKKDFALELRSVLYDGLYYNSKVGFYNFLLVLHAGVQRLINDAWAQSGMENRAPISPQMVSKHIIPFDKLNKDHAILLIKKYLKEYKIDDNGQDNLLPFTEEAVSTIGVLSEYNAAKILKMSYDLLEKASENEPKATIDKAFVNKNKGTDEINSDTNETGIDRTESTDLIKKALE
ncbi:MAG: hypothetical protein WD267_06510 [Balneolales bacterium]